MIENADSLNFLVDDNSEEEFNKQILQKLDLTGEPMIKMYEQNDGIKVMKRSGKNGYIQAVL